MRKFKTSLAAAITAAAAMLPISSAQAWNMNFFDEDFSFGESWGSNNWNDRYYGGPRNYPYRPRPNRNNWGGNNFNMPSFDFGDGWGPGFNPGSRWGGPKFGSSWDNRNKRRYGPPPGYYGPNGPGRYGPPSGPNAPAPQNQAPAPAPAPAN